MLTAIAIDDEPLALEVIRNLSAKIPFIRLEETFANPFEAIDYLNRHKIDLLFLDIKMPDITGIDLLKSLPYPALVIFTTAYSEHAVQSFELDAIDYLLKPFSQARFLKACNKAREQYELKNNAINEKKQEFFFVKSGTEEIRIDKDELLYVESVGNYVQFICKARKVLSRLTMSEAGQLLPAPEFIRIHRSFIISQSKISKKDRRSVWIDKIELPIGAKRS